MRPFSEVARATLPRRAVGRVAAGALASALLACDLPRLAGMGSRPTVVVHTFGDSILDCGRYNDRGVTPGALLVRNDDDLFPAFRGRDLSSRGPARLEHHARDGATVDDLPAQARGLALAPGERAMALLTVGGNDLLRGLIDDPDGSRVQRFAEALDAFLAALPIRPVLVGNVYDPTFGDDRRNFLPVDPALARANQQRLMQVHAEMGRRYGALVDLHAHFLRGDPSWFSHTIEPSLVGASEVRAAFLDAFPA